MWCVIYKEVLYVFQPFSHFQGNMLYKSGLYWKLLQSVQYMKGFKILISYKYKNFYNIKYKIVFIICL